MMVPRLTLLLLFFWASAILAQQPSNKFVRCNESSSDFIGCKMCSARGAHSTDSNKAPSPRTHLRSRANTTNLQKTFSSIYAKGIWGGVEDGGGSGSGSREACAVTAREVLRLVLFKYNLLSLLDAPCGGVHSSWMRPTIFKMRADLPCFSYFGVDAADAVVRHNSVALRQHNDWISFATVDLSAPPPGWTHPGSYDLILSRDALQHLSYEKIAGTLSTYCSPAVGAKFLLVGSYLSGAGNKPVVVGDVFEINLLQAPFSFPSPLEIFHESTCYTDTPVPVKAPVKSLLLYSLPALCSSSPYRQFLAEFHRQSGAVR